MTRARTRARARARSGEIEHEHEYEHEGPILRYALVPLVLSAVMLLLGLAGCGPSSPVLSLGPPARPPTASQYDKIRERWTRSDKILKALDTPLHVYATLFSPEFAAAYLAKRTEMFRYTPPEQAAQERLLREEAGGGFYFFVSAASHEWNWLDFERPNSVWRIALLNSKGEQVAASKIQAERRITATITELFPYVTDFHRVYSLRFPLTLPDGRPLLRGGEERLTLLFTGPLGHAELVWRLR